MRRRALLEALGAGAVVGAARPFILRAQPTASPWDQLPAILTRIQPPIFPSRDFNVTEHGAVGNNAADNTEAFRSAIAACSRAGGGRVVVPKGEFLTGAIELKSGVNLHVESGATIRFTHEAAKYPLVFTRREGMELMNYSPFIYAFEQRDIAITGQGTLDGNSDREHWWPWNARRFAIKKSKDSATWSLLRH